MFKALSPSVTAGIGRKKSLKLRDILFSYAYAHNIEGWDRLLPDASSAPSIPPGSFSRASPNPLPWHWEVTQSSMTLLGKTHLPR